jgi:hypothetical protein
MRAELRVSQPSSRPPPGRVAGWRLPRKRGTRETKKEEASSETRRLRVGARGVRADAIEMRTFSRVLPLRSDANLRAARFAVRNPPFARRGSVHSRARRSTNTKYRPTALTTFDHLSNWQTLQIRLHFEVASNRLSYGVSVSPPSGE